MAIINGTEGNDNGGMPGGPVQQGPALYGTDGDDTIHGFGGDDLIDGGLGNDLLYGDDGTDRIFGGYGNDRLDGGAGDDWLEDGYGVNSFYGGDGNDTIIALGDSGQIIDGGAGDDYISIGSGFATVDGGSGSDQFNIGSINNVITSGAGSDRFIVPNGSFNNRITDFTVGNAGDVIDLASMTNMTGYEGGNPIGTGFIRLVQSGSDTLVQLDADGTAGPRSFVTMIVLQNVAASDLTAVNLGGYNPSGGASTGLVINGTAGDDSGSADMGGGSLALVGTVGNDTIHGFAGNDRLNGGDGDDLLYGDEGDDYLDGSFGNDVLDGGAGKDRLADGRGSNSFYGGAGNDNILSLSHAGGQLIDGGDDDDTIEIDFGHGSISGGAGNDTVKVGYFSVGNTITGGAGVDTFSFDKSVSGNQITDFVAGANGDVLLLSALLPNTSYSGGGPIATGIIRLVQSGADVLVQLDEDGPRGGGGFITVVTLKNVTAGSLTAYNLGGYNPTGESSPGQTINGTSDDDARNDVNTDLPPALHGTVGDDIIHGLDGNDNLDGDDGDDQLFGDAGNDSIYGGYGNDVLDGGPGNDNLTDNHGRNSYFGGDGDDTIIAISFEGELQTVDGGAGNDAITMFIGAGTATGGAGSDRIEIGGQNNHVTVSGGADVDTFILSADPFNLNDKDNVITDFNAAAGEVINVSMGGTLNYFGGNPFADGHLILVQSGDDTLVRMDVDGSAGSGPFVTIVKLLNVSAASLTAANFNGYTPVVQAAPKPPAVAHNDFDGDGRSDILFQNSDGTVTDWLGRPDGTFTGNAGKFNVNIGTAWHVVGTGDFNGDGRADVLFQNTDGTVTDWLGRADGTFTGNGGKFSVNLGTAWHVAVTGDFNGDGRDDVLFQNTDGTVTDWLGRTDGTFAGNAGKFSVNIGTAWHVVGSGDFNGDGRDDILFQNENGTVTNWLGRADGTFTGNAGTFSTTLTSDWHIVATGDFNGDGLSDVLLRNDSGKINEWLGQANGTLAVNSGVQNTVPSVWHLVGVGDFNGDKIDDVFLQNADGSITDWLGRSDGTFAGNAFHFSVNLGTVWHVQDPLTHDPIA